MRVAVLSGGEIWDRLTTLPHAPQLLGSLRTSWHGPPLQLRVPDSHVGVVGGGVIVAAVTPMHEQALEYRTLPEQADA